eukprot:4374336-Pleurochrysis_carterae.AAC.1
MSETETVTTPGTLKSARSTASTQDAHVMPCARTHERQVDRESGRGGHGGAGGGGGDGGGRGGDGSDLTHAPFSALESPARKDGARRRGVWQKRGIAEAPRALRIEGPLERSRDCVDRSSCFRDAK